MSAPLLKVENLQAWYGESHVLHGVDMHVDQGEMICILGRNGMGKTTTLRTIMGILRKRTGKITFAGEEWLYFKAIAPQVAIIRATTADERGNLTYEHEGAYLGGLDQALAAGIIDLPRICTADRKLHFGRDLWLSEADLAQAGKAIGALVTSADPAVVPLLQAMIEGEVVGTAYQTRRGA